MTEVDARWPGRDRASDGWIGDQAHRRRTSGHNPDRRGVVTAVDITAKGVPVHRVVERLLQHPSTWYVISEGVIWSRTHEFAPRAYHGSDPHTSHLHLSIMPTRAAARSRSHWF